VESIYPAGPARVPEQLAMPSKSYRRNAWLAMAGLLLFVCAYFGLLYWFGATAWRLLSSVFNGEAGDDAFLRGLAGGFAAFLAVFMAKALVFIKRGQESGDIELKPADEPRLFEFLHRLADEAKAPRPHRVFLSARVNAAVFYDLSIANLVIPSRKNLEIGLGLANVLNLGEFKAVLAHEFGHFAQRSMAVGRWVYIAQQIASHIIAKRDALDKALQVISSIDLRIAWVGWLLQLIVWSIRSLVELLFRVVVLAQRALSREMEYQADLVAASLTGSDALVHALHRLNAADDAWNRACGFAASESANKRPVLDMFPLQLRYIERMREIYNDAGWGVVPAVPEDAASHRLFLTELAQPPRMWATHPANADREQNVKRQYIAAAIDERPAMTVFADPKALAAAVTEKLFPSEGNERAPLADSLARLDAGFQRPSLHKRYRGAYLGRSPFRVAATAADLYKPVAQVGSELMREVASLYPAELGQHLDQLRDLEQELATLDALRNGFMKAPGGVVRWRGSELNRRELPKAIAGVEAELAEVRRAVFDHDLRCRSLHLAAAREVGGGWDEYLRSLAAIAHYADHVDADVRDASGLLDNTLAVVLADRKVSADELRRVLVVARQLRQQMADVHGKAHLVVLDEAVATRLEAADWPSALEEFRLGVPDEQNIQGWLQVVDGWVASLTSSLSALRLAALETLLATEDRVAAALSGEGPALGAAPAPLRCPEQYPVLLPGRERRLQTKLGWWDRFQTADGAFASIARLAVAGSIVGAVLLAGASIGSSRLGIYNGLSIPVTVTVDGASIDIAPYQAQTLSISADGTHQVEATTLLGERIEAFEAQTDHGAAYAYNVAQAAALVSWDAVYGGSGNGPEKVLGAPRWMATQAEYVFSDPPTSIRAKSSGESRSVLSAYARESAGALAGSVTDPGERAAMVSAHARWDDGSSQQVVQWMAMASEQGDVEAIVEHRLKSDPHDVLALRLEQDANDEDAAHRAVCLRHQALADAKPNDADLHYIALRCRDRGTARDQGFIAAQQRWPDNGWLMLGAGYSHSARRQWQDALTLMDKARQLLPATSDWLAVDMARMLRVSGAEPASIVALSQASGSLQFLLAGEAGAGVQGGSLAAVAALEKGQIAESVGLASADPAFAAHMLWLAAASDGAPAHLVRQALAQPTHGQDEVTHFVSLALAVREGMDATHYRTLAGGSKDEEAGAILDFFDAVRAGKDPASAEAALGDVTPRSRGIAYSMAAIMRGADCPREWREGARKLLFGGERPYFAS
jgi:Zn-dependent protease with chaperone function